MQIRAKSLPGKKRKSAIESYYRPHDYASKKEEKKDEYLLVDGYNIIYHGQN